MSAFVCRGDVVATVTGALEQPPTLVLVEGEAGIGKTRLVQECLWSGRWPERTVLMVECQPMAAPLPLSPVVDGLWRLRETVGMVELSALGGALRPLFPEWADELPPPPEALEDSAARRHLVYRALAELVDRLRVDLLVVEDAHWADTATLEWLLVAAGSGGGKRSTVVTFRPRTVPALPAQLRRLASRLAMRMGKHRVVLEPLDVSGIQQLTAAMFRTEVSREFAQFLHERTGGIPLAVEEVLKLLRDRGDIMRRDGGWSRKELAQMQQVPPDVRDSVLERVERLAPPTRRVLEAAAVLGEPAEDRLLAEVAGLERVVTRSAVAAGFRAGLLRGAGYGRVAYRHQLAAEAVEGEVPAYELARLHLRAGRALERVPGASVARLSRHFKDAGDVQAWARYAEASADLALASGDDYTAVVVLHELLTGADHPVARRSRLARKLGEAAAGGAAGLGELGREVIEALRAALAGGGIAAGERGEIRLLLGRLLRWYGRAEEALAELDAAVADLDDRPGLACRAMLNLGAAMSGDWSVSEHLVWLEKAAARLGQVDSPAERLNLAAQRVSVLLALGEEAAWHAVAELPPAGPSRLEQWTSMLSLADVGRMAIRWGHYGVARARLQEMLKKLEIGGYPRMVSLAQIGCAYLDWHTGQWAGLGRTAAEVAEDRQVEPATVRIEAREIQGLVELASGARAQAERYLREALQAFARYEPLGHQASTTVAALGRLHLAGGDEKEALRITELVMTRIARKGLWLWAAEAAPVHIDALTRVGELEQAEDLAAEFATWQRGRHAPAPAAASVMCEAIVTEARGDLPAAADLFGRAASAWAGLPRPHDELLALERQGQCLLAAEQPDQAVAVLAGTLRRLRELGARRDADRVARVLRQYGVEVPRSDSRLSPREREVVALVAQGLTNREVGRVLFLSPRTVGDYLSSAMRKLQVTTRTAAAVVAADAGLIPPA